VLQYDPVFTQEHPKTAGALVKAVTIRSRRILMMIRSLPENLDLKSRIAA